MLKEVCRFYTPLVYNREEHVDGLGIIYGHNSTLLTLNTVLTGGG